MIAILFFLPDLNGGGAQRTVVNVINHINRESFRPLLVLGSAKGPYLDAINKEIEMIDLARGRVRNTILPLAKQIRTRKPDILFSPYPDANVALMLATNIARWEGNVVLRESNHRTAQEVDWGVVKQSLVRWAYRRADWVVALSEGVRKDLMLRYGLRAEKVQTIYNPIDLEDISRKASEPVDSKSLATNLPKDAVRLIAIGRLERQKGFDILIRALARVKEMPLHLTILGEGSARESLRRLADDLGVGNLVYMPGFQSNPYNWLKHSDIFILSSRWEGFGHVIVEAMACGLPVIASRCRSGPDEIISDGVNGLLVEQESIEDLSRKIAFLVNHPGERIRISTAAPGRAERFHARRIVEEYENLFKGLIR